jgi:hypothetical protein
MYIAAFLFCLDDFPIMFGTSYKPVSIIFILLYILCHLSSVFHLKFKRAEIYILVILLMAVCISLAIITGRHYSPAGLYDAVQSLFAGIVCYIGFKIFVQQCEGDDEKFTKFFTWIVRGYGIAVFVGILQLIYIYVIPSGALSQIIQVFVERIGFIENSRVHMSFSEASFIGLHTNLLLLPSVIILKNRGRLTRNHIIIVSSFLFLSLFSLSIRYFIDILVFIAAYLIFTTHSRILLQRMLTFLVSTLAVFLLINAIFVQNVFHLQSYHYYRMANIITDPSSAGDDTSTLIRTAYTKTGLVSFIDHPLVGYGLGNFHYAYMDHYKTIDPEALQKSEELRNAATGDGSLQSYNMYSRLLSEMGLPGLLVIILTLCLMIHSGSGNFSKLMVFLVVYSQIQFDSLALIPLYFWIALLDSRFIRKINVADVPRLSTVRERNLYYLK